MIVAGIDQSKTLTGVAIFPTRHHEDCITLSLRCPAKRAEGLKPTELSFDYIGAVTAWYDFEFAKLIRRYKIDRVAAEMPLPGNAFGSEPSWGQGDMLGHNGVPSFGRQRSKGSTNIATTQIQAAVLAGIAAACSKNRVPGTLINSSQWRKACGIGKPPKSITRYDKKQAWYKAQSKTWCDRMHIRIRNADEADAAAIGFYHWCILNPRLAAATGDLFRHRGAA